ncbi:RHS repeat-associated core domain-containing protein [Kosakonia sp. HypNH10]|uniref:RHS repeat-associated core domain-containing protein n=1 Tax=Kosakonia sp. HypNH10 TaxID=2980101 RepID=UPI00326622A2
MVGETSDSYPDAAVQYIHTENSYEPLARVDSHGEHADIFWYHTELNGLPDSVTDSSGDTVWRGASTAWGRSLRESTPVDQDTPQNLRFQGQYLDRETGLHYNTFRYYDPAGGCYTQMDPIGLAGGLNTYTYVVDPLGWVDPLGLAEICGKPKSIHKLSSPNPVPRSVSHEYDNIITGTGTPRLDKNGKQKVFENSSGKANRVWNGAKEWQVVHRGQGLDPHHRILEQTLPDGRKIYGYVLNHDYDKVYKFPSPWYPDGGSYPGHKAMK